MANEMSKDTEEKIKQLQIQEQSLSNLMGQKQQFQIQQLEIDSALKEIEKTKQAYKMVGNIMAEANKDDLKKELLEKKEVLDMRVKAIEKQEKGIKEKTAGLQKEVMSKMG